jgi:uroporphyrinogen-III decarboxylase
VLGAFSAKPFIFNLGHGILPETAIAMSSKCWRVFEGDVGVAPPFASSSGG